MTTHTDVDPERQSPATETRSVRVPLLILALCAATAMLQWAAPVLLPVVLSVLLFYALDPIVDRVEKLHVPRLAASFFVVLALVGGLGAGGYALWPQFDAVVRDIPDGAARLRTTFREQRQQPRDSLLQRVQDAAKAIDSAAAEVGEPAAKTPGVLKVEVQQPFRASDVLWSSGRSVIGSAGQAVTILFLTIFLLNEDDSFKRKLVNRMETMGNKRVTVKILNDIAAQIENFIWVQAATSAFVAIVTAVALAWLDVKQPIVWGLFAGVLNIVPYFGPLIVSAVLAAVAFLQFGEIGSALTVAAITMAITTFEGMFLTPHLIGKAAALNSVAIFLAIAFWSWAWGVPGMLLAVPILMAVKAVCDHVDGLQGLGEFLGE